MPKPSRSMMAGAARLARRLALGCSLAAPMCSPTLAHATPACPPAAHAPSAEQAQAGQRGAKDRGFLWRISKDARTSYLYGTIHVAKLQWIYPGPQVSRALEASDTLALEIDGLDPQMQQRLAQGMAATNEPALPAPLQERLRRRAEAECLPPHALALLAPEMQVTALMTLAARRDGLDPAYGIDMFLSGWGHASRKNVVSLETPELQLAAMRLDTAGERDEFIESALDDMERGRAGPALKRTAQIWSDADLEALTHYETWCECTKTAADRATMKRMLEDRNPALADGIAALHDSGKQVFAAVGSLHMIGPFGLPQLLARRGFGVQRVEYRR